MTILWEFDEKHPKQVSAYGTQSGVVFNRPSGTQFRKVVPTQTLQTLKGTDFSPYVSALN
jgi:hypothetical protein